MKTINIDDKTAHRLRIYVAEQHLGKVYGNIGITAAEAINQFIDEKEKIIYELAASAEAALERREAQYKERHRKDNHELCAQK